MDIHEQIQESIDRIRKTAHPSPEIGLVLGSGLGGFADCVAEKTAIPFSEIPYFKKSAVAGHAGELILGLIKNKAVAVLSGRYHYYEGHDIKDVVYPARVLCGLGIRALIITNAAGGISRSLKPGDLMLIKDHINLMGINPLGGPNDDKIGPRFPDMSRVYDDGLREILASCCSSIGIEPKEGVYAAVSGPSYETPAEIKMMSALGADAVGMSTVPEAIAARHMGVAVAGISCITNTAAGMSDTPLDHKEVIETADRTRERFNALLREAVRLFQS